MKKRIFIISIAGLFFFSSCGSEEKISNDSAPIEETEETSMSGSEETSSNVESEEAESNSDAEVSTDASDLIGQWKLASVDLGVEVPDVQKGMMDQMINSMIENTTMTFNEDGTFESKSMVMGQKKEETGTWKLDGMILTSTNEAGESETVTLTTLTDSEIVISVEENGNTMTMSFEK